MISIARGHCPKKGKPYRITVMSRIVTKNTDTADQRQAARDEMPYGVASDVYSRA